MDCRPLAHPTILADAIQRHSIPRDTCCCIAAEHAIPASALTRTLQTFHSQPPYRQGTLAICKSTGLAAVPSIPCLATAVGLFSPLSTQPRLGLIRRL